MKKQPASRRGTAPSSPTEAAGDRAALLQDAFTQWLRTALRDNLKAAPEPITVTAEVLDEATATIRLSFTGRAVFTASGDIRAHWNKSSLHSGN